MRDPEPRLLYRQHGANAVGANRSLRAKLHRILLILRGNYSAWNDVNLAAHRANVDLLTEDNRRLLFQFSRLRTAPFSGRMRQLAAAGLYRQSALGTCATWLACMIGKI